MKVSKKYIYPIFLFALSAMFFNACKDDNSPGYEYMPNMYRTPAVEPYSKSDITVNGVSAMKPVEGTIARGQSIYALPNTNEGYEASANITNPIQFSEDALKRGKEVYKKMCVHCHGKTGQGDGAVPSNSDFPPPPAYTAGIKDLPAGKIFHSITYGKNLMGGHASQISKEDRWQLVYYIQSLQDPERFDKMYRSNEPAAEEMPTENVDEMVSDGVGESMEENNKTVE